MRTQWAPQFPSIGYFALYMSTPIYDGYDSYRGERYVQVQTYATVDEAVTKLFDEADDDREVGYFIVHPTGYIMPFADFAVNSYYSGPVDPEDPNIPF